MFVDMNQVPWRSRAEIHNAADDLLCGWKEFCGEEIAPPIPVEAIAEKYLGITIEYDDLGEILGIPDALGATWVKEKRMVVNSGLLEGVEGRIGFTCGHEIGHWFLHRNYLVDRSAQTHGSLGRNEAAVICRISNTKARGEWQADYFSACLLMPEAEVRQAYQKAFGVEPLVIYNEKSCFPRHNPIVLDPSLDTAKEIAERVVGEGNFTNVSKEAMCYRLEELGILINQTGKSLFETFRVRRGIHSSSGKGKENNRPRFPGQ